MERVFIYQQKEYDPAGIREVAREIIDGSGVSPKGKSVFVKPSFVYPSHSPATVGIVTQPPFVRGVVQALLDLGAKKVMVGEDSVLGPSRAAFYAMGVYPYIHDIATPIYFDEERHKMVDVPNPVIQGSFVVPAIWPEADLFVSLPKIKVNQFAKVTLSVKNNLGFQRQGARVHNHNDGTLQEKIADLYRVRPPDLVLADSIVAGEGQGPMLARPYELGVMVGGANGVAVDAVACRLMGFDPFEIEHLRYLEDAGIGPLSDRDIEVVGEKISDFAHDFDRPSTQLVGIHPNLRVFQGSERCCANGCRGMVRCALDAWLENNAPLREMNIVVGKGVGDLPRKLPRSRTLIVGDCAVEHASRGHFISGCPPLPMRTAMTLAAFQTPLIVTPSRYKDLASTHQPGSGISKAEHVFNQWMIPNPMLYRDIAKGYVAGYGWKAAKFFRPTF